jgi:hypothetical protein
MEETQSLLVNYDRLSAEEAFAQSRTAAEALSAKQLQGRAVLQHVVTVLDVVRVMVGQAKKDVGELVKMPGVKAGMVEELSQLRLAYWHASLEVAMSQSESKRKNILAISQQLRSIRRRLFGGMDVIWAEDSAMQERLALLRKGSGYADLASDVVALVALYRPRLEEAAAWLQRAPLEALLDEGNNLAPLLLDTRNEEGETTDTEKKLDTQRRLFVLMEDIYNEFAAAGLYLFRRDAEHAALYPLNLRTAYMRALPASNKAPATNAKSETAQNPASPSAPPTEPAPPSDAS